METNAVVSDIMNHVAEAFFFKKEISDPLSKLVTQRQFRITGHDFDDFVAIKKCQMAI